MAWSREKWRAVLLDFLERAGWSAGQVFIATLLAGGTTLSVADLPWRYASTLAVSAAVSSAILTVLQYSAKVTSWPFWPDLLIRLVKTFLSSLAASVAAAGVFDVTTFEWSTALNVAVVATLGGLAKGLLAREPARAAVPAAPASAESPKVPSAGPSPSTLPLDTYAEATK